MSKEEEKTEGKRKYESFFKQSVWAFARDVERVIRKYRTEDWKREPFSPNIDKDKWIDNEQN